MLTTKQEPVSYLPDQLLERIQAGDRQAEHELVNTYWRSLYFFLNKRANDGELAADIAQEAFLIVLIKARNGEIKDAASLASFIRKVGINLLIASYRKDARRKTEPNEKIEIEFPHQQNDILDRLSQQQLSALVKQVLDELPTERDRDLLYRYFVYGQSKQLIRRELSLSDAHFDRVLYRARNRFKQVIQLRFDIDISKQSLTSLLTVLLAFLTTMDNRPSNLITNEVGDTSASHHSSVNTVIEVPTSILDSAQHQGVKR